MDVERRAELKGLLKTTKPGTPVPCAAGEYEEIQRIVAELREEGHTRFTSLRLALSARSYPTSRLGQHEGNAGVVAGDEPVVRKETEFVDGAAGADDRNSQKKTKFQEQEKHWEKLLEEYDEDFRALLADMKREVMGAFRGKGITGPDKPDWQGFQNVLQMIAEEPGLMSTQMTPWHQAIRTARFKRGSGAGPETGTEAMLTEEAKRQPDGLLRADVRFVFPEFMQISGLKWKIAGAKFRELPDKHGITKIKTGDLKWARSGHIDIDLVEGV